MQWDDAQHQKSCINRSCPTEVFTRVSVFVPSTLLLHYEWMELVDPCAWGVCCAKEASSQRVRMNGGSLICGPHLFAIELLVPYMADTYLHPVCSSELILLAPAW